MQQQHHQAAPTATPPPQHSPQLYTPPTPPTPYSGAVSNGGVPAVPPHYTAGGGKDTPNTINRWVVYGNVRNQLEWDALKVCLAEMVRGK